MPGGVLMLYVVFTFANSSISKMAEAWEIFFIYIIKNLAFAICKSQTKKKSFSGTMERGDMAGSERQGIDPFFFLLA